MNLVKRVNSLSRYPKGSYRYDTLTQPCSHSEEHSSLSFDVCAYHSIYTIYYENASLYGIVGKFNNDEYDDIAIAWDIKDFKGQRVGSGIYLIKSEHNNKATKFIVLR